MAMCVAQHRRIEPLHKWEVQRVLRKVAIKLGLKDPVGRPYTEETDVRHMYQSFLHRMHRETGIKLASKPGHGMVAQHAYAASKAGVQEYVNEVRTQTLRSCCAYLCLISFSMFTVPSMPAGEIQGWLLNFEFSC